MRFDTSLHRRALASVILLTAVALAPSTAAAQADQGTGDAWRLVQPPQSSLILARDGSLIGEIGRQVRTSVSIRSLPKYVSQAFIAVEDQRFYEHDGVDLIGVAAAIKDNIMGDRRGASTITQQLVGNMHPDIIDRRDRGIGRKLREQSAAREMEKHYTKEQILEAYLNQVDLGHNWFGVDAAARHYFGKPAAKLTLAEAASLASLPKSPPLYDPSRYPARNKGRRDLILGLMAAQKLISQDDAARARAEPVTTVPNAGYSAQAQYFVDAARQAAQRAGIQVMDGGYRIHTTLDPVLQREAVTALVEGTAQLEMRPGYKHPVYTEAGKSTSNYLQGAVVAMDPFTGDVRALVGGRNYLASPYNRAFASRQPGSSIKPFVYSAALLDSMPPNAIVYDTALAIPEPSGDVYTPGNADGQFLGPMTMHEALVKSRNPVAVALGQQIGIDTIAALVRRAGIASPMAIVPSSAIGASAVRPVELVAAYSAFDNNGNVVSPRLITRIDDASGRAIYSAPPSPPTPVIDPRVAFIMRRFMEDVAARGTGTAARRAVPPAIPVAGKTGTTNDNADVWFVGMTPDLVAGVWLGFDSPKMIAPGAAGGSLSAPIWGQMIARYYAATGGSVKPAALAQWNTPPAGMVYAVLDRDTGELATADTPQDRRQLEFFMDGIEPAELKVDPWRTPQFGPLIFH